MLVAVYRVRRHGVVLPRPQQAVQGHLIVEPWRDGFSKPILCAKLLLSAESQTLLLPVLYGAEIRRVTAAGIHVAGREQIPRRASNKASVDYYRQTWWCLVSPSSDWDGQ